MGNHSVYAEDYYDPTLDKMLAACLFSLAVLVLLFNGLEIYLMIRLRNERSVTTVFTVSLTLVDIIMGSMGIPFSAIAMSQQRRWIFGNVMCNISGFCINTCIFTSLFSICLITVNRFLALVFPIRYKRHMKIGVAQAAVLVVWILGCIRSMVPFFFGKGYEYYLTTLCSWSTKDVFQELELPFFYILLVVPFCLSFSVIVYCSLHMVICLVQRSIMKKDSQGGQRGDKEKDAVITTLLIIAAFIVSYFCYYFSIFGYLFANGFQSWSNKSFMCLEIMLVLTIYTNSLFNPILYIIRNTKYKKELAQMKGELVRTLRLKQTNGGVCEVKICGRKTSKLRFTKGLPVKK